MKQQQLFTGYNHFPFHEIFLSPKNWPESLRGMRIVQLSDLHLHAKVDLAYLKELIRQINAKDPDLVLFTGDLIQTHPAKLQAQLHAFHTLRAPAYYVTGNHDIYYGPKALQQILEKLDIHCLDNTYITLDFQGRSFQLAGVSDRYSFMRNIKRPISTLFSRMDDRLPTILMAHQPKDINLVKTYRVDLQLSGHTHGGQVYPFNHLVKLFQPYFAGQYEVSNTLLYVSHGLGYWGLPVRYKAAPEIPVFTIG